MKINTNYKSFYPKKEIKVKSVLTIQAKTKNNLESIKSDEKKEKIKKDKRKRAQSEKKKKFKEDFDINKYDEIGENIKDYIKSPLYKSQKKLYNLKDKKEADDYSEIPEEYTNKIKANNEKNITKKRISLSPNPRRSTTFFNKKKLAEIEKINEKKF